MKKILLVELSFYGYGGAQAYLLQLATLLKKQGFEIIIISNTQVIEKLGESSIRGIFFSHENFLFLYLKAVFLILITITKEGIHHIHLNGARTLLLIPFLYLFVSKITATTHGVYYPQNYWVNKIRNKLTGWYANRIQQTICVSLTLKKAMMAYGAQANRLKVVHNTPLEGFVETIPAVSMDGNTLRILMPARIDKYKGQQDLIEACVGIEGVTLLFAGGGDCDQLHEYCKSHQMEDKVQFLGYLENPLMEISKADVIALPSYQENCPLSILEGMGMGKPILASNIPAIQELVRDGIDGRLVPPGNIELLRSAIMEFKNDFQLLQQMGKSARQRVEDEFSSDQWEQKTLTIFQ